MKLFFCQYKGLNWQKCFCITPVPRLSLHASPNTAHPPIVTYNNFICCSVLILCNDVHLKTWMNVFHMFSMLRRTDFGIIYVSNLSFSLQKHSNSFVVFTNCDKQCSHVLTDIITFNSHPLLLSNTTSISCVCVVRFCMCVSCVLFQLPLFPTEAGPPSGLISSPQTVSHSGGPRLTHQKPIDVAVNVNFCRFNSPPSPT